MRKMQIQGVRAVYQGIGVQQILDYHDHYNTTGIDKKFQVP